MGWPAEPLALCPHGETSTDLADNVNRAVPRKIRNEFPGDARESRLERDGPGRIEITVDEGTEPGVFLAVNAVGNVEIARGAAGEPRRVESRSLHVAVAEK